MTDTAYRVNGLLLGLAAGDKIGGPLHMALCLAESLQYRQNFDRADIQARYLAWWQAGGFDTGPTAAKIFTLAKNGSPWEESVEQVDRLLGGYTAGCNPAHRAAPLAMAHFLPDAHLAAHAEAEARLTHKHPLAGDVAAAVVLLCRALIRGVAWDEACLTAAQGRHPETRDALKRHNADTIDPGGYAPEVFRAALHFLDGFETFSEALHHSVDFAGPSNYCPVLVGSIGGARWGTAVIAPEDYRHHEALMPQLRKLSEALARDWEATTS